MGPLLGVASRGLRDFLDLHRPSHLHRLGAWSNSLAGALLTATLLVQLAVASAPAIGAFGHPRLGRLVGCAGLPIAVGLLALDLHTFPTPPADAGFVDLGPAVGLWYLLTTILALRSLPGVRAAVSAAG